MTQKMRSLLVGFAAIVILAGCSSENQKETPLRDVFAGSLKEAVGDRNAELRPVVTVTPKMLAETKIAALQVNPEKAGGSDFLRRVAQRRDSVPGVVEIWSSSDRAQVFLRGGVLVGTRGVGTDIISSNAGATVNAIARRGSGAGQRSYVVSNGDNSTTEIVLNCQIDNLGTEEIIIVNQSFTTSHLRETCTGGPTGDTNIINQYWVQNSSGLVKKSRQWAGPASGYFELILLKN
ncbi:hypothetical protein C1J03_22075 [Sulfitobacter sp. SK012]|uniref:YjbF family lipoprotein n=1 Tax=Sulfitobacter sp. SK012 TaxID=1389005 RepID=UPI000E09EBCD|nr:YjbF family lipoprotein [Sulfitobacter sp. SK012]AXI48441.1 hypothetical protein C1J03_22075 [Sulfitobacter sp. SK012]